MEYPVGLEHCFSFINCQLNPAARPVPHSGTGTHRTAVTISRQAGCGALVVAEQLAARLQARAKPGAPPWTVFDRNLMEKVLEDHNLPTRLAKYLPEDRISEVEDIMEELFGLHPPSWTIVPQISETILHLAELGNVILIGRGGNVITAKLSNVFHVRLVAPLEQRIEHAHEFYQLSKKAAREFCLREDGGRRRYLKKHFKADVDDPLLCHLTINTGLISYADAAEMIATAMLDYQPVRKSPLP